MCQCSRHEKSRCERENTENVPELLHRSIPRQGHPRRKILGDGSVQVKLCTYPSVVKLNLAQAHSSKRNGVRTKHIKIRQAIHSDSIGVYFS